MGRASSPACQWTGRAAPWPPRRSSVLAGSPAQRRRARRRLRYRNTASPGGRPRLRSRGSIATSLAFDFQENFVRASFAAFESTARARSARAQPIARQGWRHLRAPGADLAGADLVPTWRTLRLHGNRERRALARHQDLIDSVSTGCSGRLDAASSMHDYRRPSRGGLFHHRARAAHRTSSTRLEGDLPGTRDSRSSSPARIRVKGPRSPR